MCPEPPSIPTELLAETHPETSDAGRAGDSERGASLIEYSLLIALIALVALGAVATFGLALGPMYSESSSSMFSP